MNIDVYHAKDGGNATQVTMYYESAPLSESEKATGWTVYQAGLTWYLPLRIYNFPNSLPTEPKPLNEVKVYLDNVEIPAGNIQQVLDASGAVGSVTSNSVGVACLVVKLTGWSPGAATQTNKLSITGADCFSVIRRDLAVPINQATMWSKLFAPDVRMFCEPSAYREIRKQFDLDLYVFNSANRLMRGQTDDFAVEGKICNFGLQQSGGIDGTGTPDHASLAAGGCLVLDFVTLTGSGADTASCELAEASGFKWTFRIAAGYPVAAYLIDASGSMGANKDALQVQLGFMRTWIQAGLNDPVKKYAKIGSGLLHKSEVRTYPEPPTDQLGIINTSTISKVIDVPDGLVGGGTAGNSPIGDLVWAGKTRTELGLIAHDRCTLILLTDGLENSLDGDLRILAGPDDFHAAAFRDWYHEKNVSWRVMFFGDPPAGWSQWMAAVPGDSLIEQINISAPGDLDFLVLG